MPSTKNMDLSTRSEPAVRHASITPKAALLAIFCCLLWSGAYVTGKFAIGVPGIEGFGPFRAAFLRFALAGVVLLFWGLWRDPQSLRVAREDWPGFARMGLLGICLTYTFNYQGLAMSTGTAAALIMSTEPVWIAVLAVMFLKERLTRPRILGVVFGLAGALIVVASTGAPRANGTPGAPSTAVVGNILMVLSLLFESSAVLTAKRLTARYKGRTVVTFESLTGAVLLAPFAFWENHVQGPLHPSAAAWAAFLYLLIGCTLVSYTLWYHLMETTDASELTVFIFLQPVVGTLIGVALFHDVLTTQTVIGASLVVVALIAITRPSRQKTSQARAT